MAPPSAHQNSASESTSADSALSKPVLSESPLASTSPTSRRSAGAASPATLLVGAKPAPVLDPAGDVVDVTRDIVNIESVSGNEGRLADAVEAVLRSAAHLRVERDGDTVVARTNLGRPTRVVIAGHLDTVPLADNLPATFRTRDGIDELVGRGTVDMKGGVASQLKAAAQVHSPVHDVTWIFYDHEEVAAEDNALTRIAATRPELLAGDFAILGEPTAGAVEGGCKGTMRCDIRTRGVAAHSARDWVGHNAIHDLAPVLTRLASYTAREVTIDGLVYRECLNAVRISGGIAGNVIPDGACVTVNYRFAPDRDVAAAEAHIREVLAGLDVEITVTDSAPGALPGLSHPVAQEFVTALGPDAMVRAKQGWTDVARFSALGVPAINFGPGDPLLAHTDDEHVPLSQLRECHDVLVTWLTGGAR
ncbi:succinyl-diaminopimelate desuccinylase [Devriesea agamarum]|uniref:succinyl-diaminopimelate desuccinylase n=1 Tax=Devriesea agamarum TaxID=472569 RepID=UPI0009FC47E9|nr:succinyl-diaminopimelate desuccinylase [Devriesea agamarum]